MHRFVHVLTTEITEFRQRRWNVEMFIDFQTVIFQHAWHMTTSGAIRQRINLRLDAW